MPARVLAICGCTCSGKTTLARRLKEEVELQGHPRVLHLQQDDFYKAEALVPRVPHAQDPQVQFPDFDSEHSVGEIVKFKTSAPELYCRLLHFTIFRFSLK